MKIMAATNQESRLPGLKFFLFDVVVFVCIAVALLSASRDMDLLSKTGTYENGTAALCHVERDLDAEPVPCTVISTKGSGIGLDYEVHWATEFDERHVVLPMSRVLRRAEPPTPPPPTVAGAFPVGSVVELKGSSFPSVVTGVEEGDGAGAGNITYFLTNAIWDVAMPGVDGYYIQPYHTYEGGTAAHCNVERRPRVRMVPCTVVSHVGSGHDTTYKVVAQPATRGGRGREMMLSMTRVQRESREETRPAGRE